MRVEEIRAKFPAPMSVTQKPHATDSEQQYCVGGALCKIAGDDISFPCISTLAENLRDMNHALDEDDARMFAMTISKENDEEHFESAWQTLDEALGYTS